MSDRRPVLVIGSAPEAAELARAFRSAGRGTLIVGVRGRLPAVRAVLRARRIVRRRGLAAIVSSASDGGLGHVVAAAAARATDARWTAQVTVAPRPFREDRWGRVFDPRLRALRRADTIVATSACSDALHAAGVVVAVRADTPGRVIELALRVPAAPVPDGLRILMLGTVNTPHVEHLALAMHARGHRVLVAGDVVASYPPSVLPAAGVDVRALELPAIPWARRLGREFAPDVVHANWLPAYGFLAALTRLRPLVAMAWGSDVYAATPRQRRMIRFVLRRADVAMTDSADLLRRLIALGADPRRAHQLNWGVDLERFSPAADRTEVRARLGLGPGPLVLSPRALTPLYNPVTIVDAFAGVRDVHHDAQLALKHIGTDEPELGRALPAGARMVGHVPYDQLADWYRAADVCVSIPDSDSSPRSVWEAMACGCACVLSDLPWVHELVEDGRDALVVDRDQDSVAAAVLRLLEEPELAARIRARARALVVAHRDQRVEMDRLSELYENVARDDRALA